MCKMPWSDNIELLKTLKLPEIGYIVGLFPHNYIIGDLIAYFSVIPNYSEINHSE